jgi:hypothetical protein
MRFLMFSGIFIVGVAWVSIMARIRTVMSSCEKSSNIWKFQIPLGMADANRGDFSSVLQFTYRLHAVSFYAVPYRFRHVRLALFTIQRLFLPTVAYTRGASRTIHAFLVLVRKIVEIRRNKQTTVIIKMSYNKRCHRPLIILGPRYLKAYERLYMKPWTFLYR